MRQVAGERQGEQDALFKVAKQVTKPQKVQTQKTVGSQLGWQRHDQTGIVHRHAQSENLAEEDKPCLGNA